MLLLIGRIDKLRAKESIKTPNVDIALPMHLKKTKTQSISIDDPDADKQSTFNFVFMVKKGNKPQFHNMEMPSNSEFAEQFKAREQVTATEESPKSCN
jgi:hypothetical protein